MTSPAAPRARRLVVRVPHHLDDAAPQLPARPAVLTIAWPVGSQPEPGAGFATETALPALCPGGRRGRCPGDPAAAR